VATQNRLIEAEKYAQAKDIAGGFAHEIRNALFPARSWLSMLKKSAQKSASQLEHVGMINHAVARAINVTSMISRYTKLESELSRSITSISKVLNDVLIENSLRIERQRIKLEISCTDKIQAPVNRDHLYIVLNNFLLNSLDALEEKGEKGKVKIECFSEPGFYVISFEDNGPGIAEKDIGRIFDTFYSTKPATGIGLGLAMTKKIVEMYNGNIEVVSEPGSGTRFIVKLESPENPEMGGIG
jgi:signal transduction histidine kinase